MRVVFNNLATLKAKTGVGHYAARLAGALRHQLGTEELTLFPGPTLSGLIQSSRKGTTSAKSARKDSWIKERAKLVANHSLAGLFRVQCMRGRFNLYHEPNFLPLSTCLPTVVTVHDLSVFLYPQWHPADRVHRHEAMFRRSLDQVAHIITVSQAVRQEVIATLGISPARVTAVHNGVGREYFEVTATEVEVARQKFDLPAEYLLYVGTIEPRKNLLTLLQAYCDLPGELRSKCPLLIAGGWGWQAGPIADYLNDVALPRGVRHLGYVGDSDLPALYKAARALVSPSHYEGFGLPPLEMLATGGAVIASTAQAHREVLEQYAAFVRDDDLVGWRDAMASAITEDDWINQLRGNQRHAAQFSWERCAKETIVAYSHALPRAIAA